MFDGGEVMVTALSDIEGLSLHPCQCRSCRLRAVHLLVSLVDLQVFEAQRGLHGFPD
jgi:hypothetical protein